MASSTQSRVPDDRPDTTYVERPWGYFKQYANNEAVTVSLMFVQSGESLSLQSHMDRAELWIVLDDGSEIQIGDDLLHPSVGDEVWIPAQTRHRLSAISTQPVRVLEVAFGNWQQSDIIRYEDNYGRPEHGE